MSRVLLAVAALALAGCTTAITGDAQPAAESALAEFVFRPVLGEPLPAAAGSEANVSRQSRDPDQQKQAAEALDCAKPDPLTGLDDHELPLVTCDAKGDYKYVLGSVIFDGDAISKAEAAQNNDSNGWVLRLTFTAEGTSTWGEYTSTHVQEQVAIVLRTKVLSAPTIQAPILNGVTEISGDFSREDAERLADQLSGR
ncbi:precorrin-3B C(17)-methyltransferase [Lentzea tibetensis]|uniref:Precorrin-3B C(17)-methyltransferase n=1 Tax=Lentzea tibetensis TaxID=2591470 RepID=A0A563EIU2_9PSEU|nr:precorrin-3B C(17)-methyltransferase [Lentzea tibetensis]TWP46738.1 precorrin-3B C(17)-methyltransferase [Lentzea tibetensis]